MTKSPIAMRPAVAINQNAMATEKTAQRTRRFAADKKEPDPVGLRGVVIVAGAGIEPATRGFSVHCSAN
jgi:hypothetical protein